MQDIRIIRRDEVSRRTGRRETAIASDIKAGLLTPPVSIGGRAVGWPAHEVDAVIRGRIMGMPNDEIRDLVKRLIDDRAKLAEQEAA